MFRASSLPTLISASWKITQGVQSELKKLAKQEYFGYEDKITSKYMTKGIVCEDDSIQLYNDVFFKNYKKHVGRITTDLLSGECDILTEDTVIDIKTSWSINTFPMLEDEINIKDYENQLRGYMMLYDKPFAELAYCLVDTPDDLIGYENESIHVFDQIPKEKRVTRMRIERSLEWETKALVYLNECKDWYNLYIDKLANK